MVVVGYELEMAGMMYYVVMSIQPWSSMEVSAVNAPYKTRVVAPDDPNEACGFLAVFDTREKAEAWAEGSEVVEVRIKSAAGE